jgi:aerobic carbon-monoxide dehydrogenase medium subunit
MIPAPLDYVRPDTVAEALRLLAERPDATPLAGGQSLLTQLKLRTLTPPLLVDISGLPELRQVGVDDRTVRIGAMVTVAELETDPEVRRAAPVLGAALRHVADVQVRNRSTLGGTIAYADPGGDMTGAAIAAGARVRVAGPAGDRELAVEELYTGPFATVLRPGELIAEILVPRRDGDRAAYYPLARRPADPTLAGVAVVASVDGEGRLTRVGVGLVGLSDRPVAATGTAAALEGRVVDAATLAAAKAALLGEIAPLDSPVAPASYRRAVAPVVLERALRALIPVPVRTS